MIIPTEEQDACDGIGEEVFEQPLVKQEQMLAPAIEDENLQINLHALSG